MKSIAQYQEENRLVTAFSDDFCTETVDALLQWTEDSIEDNYTDRMGRLLHALLQQGVDFTKLRRALDTIPFHVLHLIMEDIEG